MSNEQLLDTAAQLINAAQSDSLMVVLKGFEKSIYVLLASVVVMVVINLIVLLTSRRRGRNHHYQDRRPGMPMNDRGKQDKGQGGGQKRQEGGGGGQKKPGDNNNRGGQRRDGQQGGRPQQERGGKPGQSSIDPMEMSLRDINQRLKNAEREQDSVRKNMKDGDGSDGEGRGGRDNRQQRGGRDGRDGRGGNRDDRGPRRDSGRDNNRGGNRPERQDRGDGARPQQEQGRFRQNEQGTDRAEAQEKPQTPDIVANDVNVSDDRDQLQHGRRFTAKRRVLPDGAGTSEDTGFQPQDQAASVTTDNSESFAAREQNDGGPENIQFGR